MAQITQLGRVMVPVSDQDAAIAFYTGKLGFSVSADIPFGDGDRWVEVEPPSGGAAIALVPARGDFQPGRMTGIALMTSDPRGDQAELKEKGVDVDPELMGGDGTVPLMFSFRDQDANGLMTVEEQWARGGIKPHRETRTGPAGPVRLALPSPRSAMPCGSRSSRRRSPQDQPCPCRLAPRSGCRRQRCRCSSW